MGVVRHLIVLWIAAASIAACTWGTYDGAQDGGIVPSNDGGPGNDTGGGFVPVQPGVGANVVSSDGVFEIDIPAGALNIATNVRIVEHSGFKRVRRVHAES